MDAAETILVPLATGFEEIEAVTIIDVLRRADLSVTVASLAPGPVRGAHGITIEADTTLDEVDPEAVGMVVLPGGMPGTTNLRDDPRVIELLRSSSRAGKPTAAICAAPIVLARAGVLDGREATCYPTFADQLGRASYLATERVVCSDLVLTSQGVGTALEFALAIVAQLRGPGRAQELAQAMIVAPGVGS